MDLSKLPSDFVGDVHHLEALRREVALLDRRLKDRELEGRELRAAVEERLRAGVKDAQEQWVVSPVTKTEAEKLAKVDDSYLVFERATHEMAYHRDLALAEAEGTRLELQASIVLLGLTV